MEITLSEIEIIPVKPHNGLVAFSGFVLNKSFYIGDVAIFSRLDQEGYRLVYPIKVLPNGLKINCFYPINREVGQLIEEAVIKAYLSLIEKVTTRKGQSHEEKSGCQR